MANHMRVLVRITNISKVDVSELVVRRALSDARVFEIHGFGLDVLPYAESVEDPGHVGCELDAGPYEAEVGCPFVDVDVLETLLCQCESGGEAAHALLVLAYLIICVHCEYVPAPMITICNSYLSLASIVADGMLAMLSNRHVDLRPSRCESDGSTQQTVQYGI